MMRKRTAIISIVVALVVGVVIGGSSKSDATPAPQVETRTVTKTQTVTKTVTPQACKDLITIDNDLFSTIGNALSQWPDTSALVSATQHVKDQTPSRTDAITACEAS